MMQIIKQQMDVLFVIMHFIKSEVYWHVGVFNYADKVGATVQSGLLSLPQDRGQCQAFVSTVMNFVVTQKGLDKWLPYSQGLFLGWDS
jgi:hypothetical protein